MLIKFGHWFWHVIVGTVDLYSLLVFVSVALITVKLIDYLRYNRKLPPGPWGLPLCGYLPFFKEALHLQFNDLAKKYGSIFSVSLGSELTVVMSDYRIIRDSFRREEFTGRPHNDFMNILDGYGIINSEGSLWKDQRKFLHNKLKNLGMTFLNGKNLESKIKHEVKVFLERLEMKHGVPTSLTSSLAVAISNVICSITMGLRFYHGDPKFKRFMDLINEGFKLFAKVTFANYIPILRYIPWNNGIRNKIEQNRSEMADFFQEVINEHKTAYDKNNINDILDAYLYEIEKAEEKNQEDQLFDGKNKVRQMQQIMGDLFSAGMETVKSTLEWSVIFMLHHPEAAKAVQDELDQVVGRRRLPTLNDVPHLPVTEATIQEILRRSNLVPLATTHATTRDVMINGYMVPAGTSVIPLLYAVHMDPELWDKPEDFRPSRFLDAEGKVYKPNFFMPFGVGRRKCLGDVLARMEIFLFFTSLLHKFNLHVPEGVALPSLQGNNGITVSPKPFTVCLLKRDLNLMDCDNNEISVNGPVRNVGSH
ncbi:PREDICTED: cytochrome P450 18a1 [Cyphomyrmex costatus]|uniref:Cytochrome P450 18a1 n=1 Tax=Cyphomyrmex costatus TaxID=456900 RepID=A0A151I688_9HYME|nr:PREDICTED: cytochrome P450 18a1 [Cyphomyrmex costatus]KYM93624.1 Cytochrome P450 18a1 [Cyphomyrmex costatus]